MSYIIKDNQIVLCDDWTPTSQQEPQLDENGNPVLNENNEAIMKPIILQPTVLVMRAGYPVPIEQFIGNLQHDLDVAKVNYNGIIEKINAVKADLPDIDLPNLTTIE